MAMLMFNDIFAKTWGSRAGPPPRRGILARGPSPSCAPGTRRRCCIAEAYWDTEWTLQQQGFGFCYDKRLYDRILDG